MHLRTLELFCEVAARRSFSKAAAACDVSQSAASQAVHILEERLGTALFDRSQRPLGLTRAGEVYFDGCRELLDGLRQVEDRVRSLKHTLSGRLRIAAIYSAGLSQMKADVKRFEELYPEVDVRVDYLHPDEVYARVLEDEADLGIVSFPRDGGEISSIPWQSQRMVLVVPPAHRFAALSTVALEELDGEDFVAFTSELTVRKQIDRWLRGAKVAVHVNHEFDNIENIKRAVEAGTGVAILPEPTVQREVEQGLLATVNLKGVEWCRPLGIVHKRHKALTNVAERFVELLRHGVNGHNPQQAPRHPAGGNGRPKSRTQSKRRPRPKSTSHR
jgi:DNA-binding transcriptional LysR family regulator